jgi:wobble nucleotide-excising tRNase
MKATDYLEKWYDKVAASVGTEYENVVILDIIRDFLEEYTQIRDQRHVKCVSSLISILKEIDQKYNKFCRLFNAKFGKEHLKEGTFKCTVTSGNEILTTAWK